MQAACTENVNLVTTKTMTNPAETLIRDAIADYIAGGSNLEDGGVKNAIEGAQPDEPGANQIFIRFGALGKRDGEKAVELSGRHFLITVTEVTDSIDRKTA